MAAFGGSPGPPDPAKTAPELKAASRCVSLDDWWGKIRGNTKDETQKFTVENGGRKCRGSQRSAKIPIFPRQGIFKSSSK